MTKQMRCLCRFHSFCISSVCVFKRLGLQGSKKKRGRSNYNPGEGDKNVLCILRNTSHRCNDKVCNLPSNSNHVNSSGRRDEKWKNVFMQVSRNEFWEKSQDQSVEFYDMTSLLYSCKKQSWQTKRCVSPANTPALFTLVYWRQIICKVTPSTTVYHLNLQTNRLMQSTWRNSLEDLFVWKQLLTVVWSPDNKQKRNIYSNWRKFIYIQSHHHEFSADHHHNHHNRLHVLHFKVMTKWDWD